MRSPTSAETSRKCGTEGCARGVCTGGEGDCAQRAKAEKSRTKDAEVRLLILHRILAPHGICHSRYADGPLSHLFLPRFSISFVAAQTPAAPDYILCQSAARWCGQRTAGADAPNETQLILAERNASGASRRCFIDCAIRSGELYRTFSLRVLVEHRGKLCDSTWSLMSPLPRALSQCYLLCDCSDPCRE